MKTTILWLLFSAISLCCMSQSENDLLGVCEEGNEAKAREIISKGADVNVKNADGTTPLMRAAQNGSFNTIKALLEAHAKLDEKDNMGCSALYYACRNCDFVITEQLVKRGAKFDQDRWGVSMLDLVVQCNDDGKLAKYVIEAYNMKTSMPDSVSKALCYVNSINTAKMLIEYGAKLNFINPQGGNPLMSAINPERAFIAEYYIGAGANINIRDEKGDGWTPLLVAVREGLPEIVTLLISKGSDIKPRLKRGPFKGMDALKMATILSSRDNADFVNRLPPIIQRQFAQESYRKTQKEIVQILEQAERIPSKH